MAQYIWKTFQQFGACSKNGSAENISVGIKVDEHVITNEQVIADHFNEFSIIHVNVAANLKQPFNPINFEKLKHYINSKVSDDVSFEIPLINCPFVNLFFSSLDKLA